MTAPAATAGSYSYHPLHDDLLCGAGFLDSCFRVR